MPHPDADDLVLFAIGEEPAPELAAHVVSCAQCTAEVARWRETSDLARQADLPGRGRRRARICRTPRRRPFTARRSSLPSNLPSGGRYVGDGG